MPTDDERDEGLDDQEEAYPSVTMPLLGEEDVRFARLKSFEFWRRNPLAIFSIFVWRARTRVPLFTRVM